MGMMRYCTRKGGFQICNGDCYWCDMYKEDLQHASTQGEGRLPLREDRQGLQEQGESRQAGTSY